MIKTRTDSRRGGASGAICTRRGTSTRELIDTAVGARRGSRTTECPSRTTRAARGSGAAECSSGTGLTLIIVHEFSRRAITRCGALKQNMLVMVARRHNKDKG